MVHIALSTTVRLGEVFPETSVLIGIRGYLWCSAQPPTLYMSVVFFVEAVLEGLSVPVPNPIVR